MNPISQLSGMPQIRAAFAGWQRTITLITITQSVIAGVGNGNNRNSYV